MNDGSDAPGACAAWAQRGRPGASRSIDRQSKLRARMLLLGALALCALGCGRADVELADGQRVSWSQWDGRWLVINYWAEWCAPCREEIPELNRLHRAGAEAGVVVLGVNFDGVTGAGMDRLIDLFAIEFPILLADPAARWAQARPSILPTTLIVDPDGNLHATLVGPQTYESLAEVVGLPVDAVPSTEQPAVPEV